LLPSFEVLTLFEKGVGAALDGSATVGSGSSAELSREMLVASVETELRTLAADDVVDETASMDERLCFDVLRRSMLSGRDDAAPVPGLRVLLTDDADPEGC
jgi:hypothetical protein